MEYLELLNDKRIADAVGIINSCDIDDDIVKCANSYNRIKDIIFSKDLPSPLKQDIFGQAVHGIDFDKLSKITSFNLEILEKIEKLWETCLSKVQEGAGIYEAVEQSYNEVFQYEDFGYDYYDVRVQVEQKQTFYIDFEMEHSMECESICIGTIPEEICNVLEKQVQEKDACLYEEIYEEEYEDR